MTFLKCEYMQHRVGQELDGIVTSVAPFGLFVELDGLYVDGLIHVSTLDGDFYQFEAKHQRLVGERTKRVFALGDRLHVRVARVSLDERRIDLLLSETVDRGSRDSRRSGPDGGRDGGRDGKSAGRGKSDSNRGARDKAPKGSKGPKGKHR